MLTLNEWQFIEPTPENLLAIEINKEINQRIYKGEDSENLSIVIDWFAKSPKQVVLPEVKEWSVNDYYAEANRTILLQLKDTTGAITDERKIVFRLESLSEILDVVSWENQLKYLKAKIVLLDSDGQKNEPKVEVNPTKKDGNKEDEKPEPSTFRVEREGLEQRLLVVHEEGKLISLPLNILATIEWMKYYGETDFVSGDAIICHPDLIR